MALAFAAALVAIGAIGLDEALAAIDMGTIVLLLAMMLIVANLRIAGFFTAAGARILAAARSPRSLLCLVILAAGLLSAFFLNDTMCLMLTPLVAELALRARRDPLPYLVAVATAANVGSCATIIGNPQNMLIGASSGIGFGRFLAMLGPISVVGLLACYLVIVLVFPKEFGKAARLGGGTGIRSGGGTWMDSSAAAFPAAKVDTFLVAKSLAAAAIMIALLLAGVKPALASLVAAAILLFTRRVSPERVFAEVDFTLLVFFAGLFIITKTVSKTEAFDSLIGWARPFLAGSGSASYIFLSAFTALCSNLVSNVPTVMLLSPLAPLFANPEKAWLILAMASTYAGNLTLLGSVANLIVAEGAKREGISLSFGAYLKAGLPITLVTITFGTAWLLLV
jgi:Na+/H+ antiporter NhaD/arsenite permease-like protein